MVNMKILTNIFSKHKKKLCKELPTATNAKGKPINWTLEKLRHELEREFGIKISNMPLWQHMRKLSFRQKVPRPVYALSSKEKKRGI